MQMIDFYNMPESKSQMLYVLVTNSLWLLLCVGLGGASIFESMQVFFLWLFLWGTSLARKPLIVKIGVIGSDT